MTGILLVAIPAEQGGEIVRKAVPSSKASHPGPMLKTPLEAARHFGTHLNMVEPPKYMAVHEGPDGKKAYIFSGGMHWGKPPLFSEAAVLLETGEMGFYNERSGSKGGG